MNTNKLQIRWGGGGGGKLGPLRLHPALCFACLKQCSKHSSLHATHVKNGCDHFILKCKFYSLGMGTIHRFMIIKVTNS